VGSVIPLPAQNAQISTQSTQASGPATAQNPQVCFDLHEWLRMRLVVFLTDSELLRKPHIKFLCVSDQQEERTAHKAVCELIRNNEEVGTCHPPSLQTCKPRWKHCHDLELFIQANSLCDYMFSLVAGQFTSLTFMLQASGPATVLSHGSYQQAVQAAPSQAMGPAASSGALQAASSLAAAQNAKETTQSALASGPATSQTYPTYQQASSQAAAPVAYSDAAASGPEAAAAPSVTTVPNSRLNQGQHCLYVCSTALNEEMRLLSVVS